MFAWAFFFLLSILLGFIFFNTKGDMRGLFFFPLFGIDLEA